MGYMLLMTDVNSCLSVFQWFVITKAFANIPDLPDLLKTGIQQYLSKESELTKNIKGLVTGNSDAPAGFCHGVGVECSNTFCATKTLN